MTAPTVIAHRGFAGVNPENTVRAVRAAADRADSVEVDVVACADGTPVVFHDARLDDGGESRGVTDGTGAVRDLSPETVTAATVGPSDETVPTFAGLCAATDAPLDVELKRPGASVRRGTLPPADRAAARERWQPFVDRVLGALDGRPVRFSSFCEGALAAVSERDPDARLAPLCRDLATGRELADRYDADAVHASLSAVGGGDGAADGTDARNEGSDERVDGADATDVDYPVNVWTVRTWTEAAAAVGAGADGVVADYPGLTRWLGGKSG